MADMGIQDRYTDISKRSGLSEEIIRRVFKASRESLAESLKKGERATLPGICTMIPEIKHKLNPGVETITCYTKVKCTPSSAMETEMAKVQSFKTIEVTDMDMELGLEQLNFKDPEKKSFDPKTYGVRTSQISALL